MILDWVPNHLSDAHPWFIESRSSRDNPKRDWYYWRDGTPDRLPNNWTRAFPPGEPAWTWDAGTDAWYLNLFSPEAARPQLGQPRGAFGHGRHPEVLVGPWWTGFASTSSMGWARTPHWPTCPRRWPACPPSH
nr:alpha-amylase family glycosyl hydrolase [Candidatus Microthrix sp.]